MLSICSKKCFFIIRSEQKLSTKANYLKQMILPCSWNVRAGSRRLRFSASHSTCFWAWTLVLEITPSPARLAAPEVADAAPEVADQCWPDGLAVSRLAVRKMGNYHSIFYIILFWSLAPSSLLVSKYSTLHIPSRHNVVLTLVQCRRLWINVKPTLIQRLMSAGFLLISVSLLFN